MDAPKGAVARWADVHRWSPAPRHRRRLILKWIAGLQFDNVLDAGCAQAYLLEQILKRYRVSVCGCDSCEQVIAENRLRFPEAEFEVVDLSMSRWPGGRQFDLVVCSEVIEHIEQWDTALCNVASMARRYLLVSVPSGTIYPIDRYVGHFRHFAGQELDRQIEQLGFRTLRSRHWGVPMHALYKVAVNRINPHAVYEVFGEATYGLVKRTVANLLYALFFVNDLFDAGGQYVVLAEHIR